MTPTHTKMQVGSSTALKGVRILNLRGSFCTNEGTGQNGIRGTAIQFLANHPPRNRLHPDCLCFKGLVCGRQLFIASLWFWAIPLQNTCCAESPRNTRLCSTRSLAALTTKVCSSRSALLAKGTSWHFTRTSTGCLPAACLNSIM